MFSTPLPSGLLRRSRAIATTAAVLGAVCLSPGAASAGPSQHVPDDLPAATEACQVDISPGYPSCAPPSEAKVAIRLPDPWFTTKPCKHDTSPNYPSCGNESR